MNLRTTKKKYRLYGIISPELKNLALDTEKLIGKWYDLEATIKVEANSNQDQNKKNNLEQLVPLTFTPKSSTKEINKEKSLLENINQKRNLCNTDISSLSDQQKYLSISGTDTENIEIINTNSHHFYSKLKTMKLNDNGELIITLTPKKTSNSFLKDVVLTILIKKKKPKRFLILLGKVIIRRFFLLVSE